MTGRGERPTWPALIGAQAARWRAAYVFCQWATTVAAVIAFVPMLVAGRFLVSSAAWWVFFGTVFAAGLAANLVGWSVGPRATREAVEYLGPCMRGRRLPERLLMSRSAFEQWRKSLPPCEGSV